MKVKRLGFIKNKGDCVACTACYSVCPTQCIKMVPDEEGFLYPMVALDNCISCGKCKEVCPIAEKESRNLNYSQEAYCLVTKDKNIWQRSTSGGAFSEICKVYADQETLICGAAWNGLSVVHKSIIGTSELELLCKSKYVASSLNNNFFQIKEHLQKGKKVIFAGTPCQVAGLKKFLNKSYKNLLLVDLICHGVGSPKVFFSCIKELEDQFQKKILSYEFRSKREVYEGDYIQKIKFISDEEEYIFDDPYIQLFLSQKCLRPSCGKNCRFRTVNREGDLTIADFKGFEQIFPQKVGTKINYSSVIINSLKGKEILNGLLPKVEWYSCSLSLIKEYNPLFYRHTWFCNEREVFFKEFIKYPEKTIKKYTHPAKILRKTIKIKIWNMLPVWLRKIIILYIFKNKLWRKLKNK